MTGLAGSASVEAWVWDYMRKRIECAIYSTIEGLPLDKGDALGHLSYSVGDAVGHDGVGGGDTLRLAVAVGRVCFLRLRLADLLVVGQRRPSNLASLRNRTCDAVRLRLYVVWLIAVGLNAVHARVLVALRCHCGCEVMIW